jgi:hypothetical protein
MSYCALRLQIMLWSPGERRELIQDISSLNFFFIKFLILSIMTNGSVKMIVHDEFGERGSGLGVY